jgi:hypothetical protein
MRNILPEYLQLPNALNVKNTAELSQDLKAIPVNLDTRPASFDMTNMYTNIPTIELIHNIDKELKKHVTKQKEKNKLM